MPRPLQQAYHPLTHNDLSDLFRFFNQDPLYKMLIFNANLQRMRRCKKLPYGVRLTSHLVLKGEDAAPFYQKLSQLAHHVRIGRESRIHHNGEADPQPLTPVSYTLLLHPEDIRTIHRRLNYRQRMEDGNLAVQEGLLPPLPGANARRFRARPRDDSPSRTRVVIFSEDAYPIRQVPGGDDNVIDLTEIFSIR